MLAREAAKAFRDGDFHVALARFQAANALVPHPTLQVNIGRSFEKLGQWENALDACRAVLAQPALPEATSQAAEECVQRVAPKVVEPIVEIRTAPPGAAVMIDGQPKGPSPWKGTVEPGKRQVDVTLPGHRPISREIIAVRGKLEALSLVLVPEAVGGVLAIRSVPPGAQLTLDGEAMGDTPLEGLGVKPGRYVLEVRKAGYRPVVLAVPVADGELVERDIALVPEGGEVVAARPQWPAWLMMGSGVVAAGVGAVFGVQAINDRQDADTLARTSTDPDSHDRYDRLVSSMEGNRTVADVMVTTGSVLMVGGLTWLLWPE
ncbi:MAG: PEGA domain-containing protein [bacterium]